MVAARIAPMVHEEDARRPLDVVPYKVAPLDRDRAGVDIGAPLPLTPIVHHEAFRPRHLLSAEQRKEMAIKQAALRIASGQESRSLREIARDIGCTHQAIDNRLLKVCEALGLHKFLMTDATRSRMRAARAAVVNAKRDGAGRFAST
jgi:hypothetical protein